MKQKRIRILLVLYIILIYSTLPLTRGILRWINASGLNEEFSLMVNVILIVSAIVLLGYLFYKKGHNAMVVLLPVVLVLPVAISLERPEERIHFLEYFLLGFMVRWAINGRSRQVVFAIFIGALDEFIQYLLPQRVGDLRDVIFNMVASIAGLWSAWKGF